MVGSFLYYARAIDIKILLVLSNIALEQANFNENAMKRVRKLLDYIATHPDAKIWCWASDMILNVHSDASYLSAAKGRSCAGGYFFFGSLPQDGKLIKINGNILVMCKILKLMASSAAEAELRTLFVNTKETRILCLTLAELGHPQP